MNLIRDSKNYIELLLFFCLKMLLPKTSKQKDSLLLINTGLIGDLIVSSVLLENSEVFNKYKKVQFLIKEQYLELFKNYSGNVEFIGYNYRKYKFSPIYKYRFLLMLRREGFEKCIHLTAARGILNEELTHLVEAKEIIALNSFWEYLGKSLGRYFDNKYSKIIASETLNEYEKHFKLMQYLGGDNQKISFNNGVTFSEKKHYKIEKLEAFKEVIVIAPFSSLMNREWKIKYYIEIINNLKENHKIVLIGSNNQKKNLEQLRNKDERIKVLAGELKVFEIPYLLKKAKLFIGQDSGITHLALKIGTPLIAIIGGGEFGRFFPFHETEKVKYLYSEMDCFLCHWECCKDEMYCLTELTPQLLLDEVEKVFLVTHEN